MQTNPSLSVIPAKAGIQSALSVPLWIPAFAGMTDIGIGIR